MPTLIDPALMRQIIMSHYEKPRNKRTVTDPRYIKIHMNSESCIDDIHVFLLVEDGLVKDCAWDGIGCTISSASTSVMSELLIGKTLEQARYIIKQYELMLDEKPFDDEVIDEAIVFINTSKQPSRIKCALIGWHGAKSLINHEGDEPK